MNHLLSVHMCFWIYGSRIKANLDVFIMIIASHFILDFVHVSYHRDLEYCITSLMPASNAMHTLFFSSRSSAVTHTCVGAYTQCWWQSYLMALHAPNFCVDLAIAQLSPNCLSGNLTRDLPASKPNTAHSSLGSNRTKLRACRLSKYHQIPPVKERCKNQWGLRENWKSVACELWPHRTAVFTDWRTK